MKNLYVIVLSISCLCLGALLFYQQHQLEKSTASLKGLIDVYTALKFDFDERQEDIMLMENHMRMQSDSIANLLAEIEQLRNTPKIIVKPKNKNEKVIPISTVSSQYYTNFLSKRYQR